MITAVISARAGSRRLKDKNILPFGDTNLLVRKIRQLKTVKGIDNIIVSSDSKEYLDMAAAEGVGVHLRDKIYSDEVSVPFGKVVKKICSEIRGEHIMWCTCTCPLTMPEHYEQAIEKYKEMIPDVYDSLLSFEKLKVFLWDNDGPMNYGLGSRHVPSQNLPDIYKPTFGIVMAPRLKMVEWEYFHGRDPYKFILDKRSSVDIDDELDMLCAKAWNAV